MATETKLVPAQAGIIANRRNAQKSTCHTGMVQGTFILFMQNKPNLLNAKMNVSIALTRD